MKSPKVVALGLDGASWSALNPWLAKGRLPNIKRIIEHGCSGPLMSIIPPVTCPGWRCYSTSKNPGQLGVFWWTGWDRAKGKLTFPNAHSFKGIDFWDYLGAAGHRVAIINMPTTYPPQAVNGVMVSGFGAPLDRDRSALYERITYPDTWWEEIRKRYDYRIDMRWVDTNDKWHMLAEIADLITMRFRLLLDLLKSGEYGFLHMTIFYINTLQHFYGMDEVVAKAWELIDKFIGRLMDVGCYLVIFSDHGMMKIEHSFMINNWLIEEGYLKLKMDAGDFISLLDSWGVQKLGWQERHVTALAQKILPWRIKDRIPGMYPFLKTNMIDQKVDWRASTAVSLSQGVIYINRKLLGENYEGVRSELCQKLMLLQLPDNGKKVIDEIHLQEDVYEGEYIDLAPDVVAMPADGFEMYGGIGGGTFQVRERAWSSGNHPEGIFMAYGEDIGHKQKSGGPIQTSLSQASQPQASLLDVAPTIMHIMDVPLAEDMRGRVLQEIFTPESRLSSKQIKYQAALQKENDTTSKNTENQHLRKSLADLGYLQ